MGVFIQKEAHHGWRIPDNSCSGYGARVAR